MTVGGLFRYSLVVVFFCKKLLWPQQKVLFFQLAVLLFVVLVCNCVALLMRGTLAALSLCQIILFQLHFGHQPSSSSSSVRFPLTGKCPENEKKIRVKLLHFLAKKIKSGKPLGSTHVILTLAVKLVLSNFKFLKFPSFLSAIAPPPLPGIFRIYY